jgi:hypothetical protein
VIKRTGTGEFCCDRRADRSSASIAASRDIQHGHVHISVLIGGVDEDLEESDDRYGNRSWAETRERIAGLILNRERNDRVACGDWDGIRQSRRIAASRKI